jgi:hypothetical protein
VPSCRLKKPRSYCVKLTSHTLSLPSLMPTFWPANTVLRLILRRPMQIRPQLLTVTHVPESTQPDAIADKAQAVRAATLLHFRRASSMLCDSVMTDIPNQRRS